MERETWLPFEDRIAGESERLVLKYNPKWSGAGETIHPIGIPDCSNLKMWFHIRGNIKRLFLYERRICRKVIFFNIKK